MITPDELLQRGSAEGLAPLLHALWHDARGEWEAAHEMAQSVTTSEGAWVHAYLHRKEGDLSNADYWYSRAGHTRPSVTLEAEWADLVAGLQRGGF